LKKDFLKERYNMCSHRCSIGILILVLTAFSVAEIANSNFKISGWGFLTYGNFVKSSVQKGNKDYNLEGPYADFDAGLKTVFSFGKYGKGRFHFGLATAFMADDDGDENVEMKRRRCVPYLIDAAIEFRLKIGNNTFFTEFGWLPVKYNPQARNLGEYLFRSNCYPNVVVSGFELADKEKLIGWHGMYQNDFTEKSWVKGDAFYNVEMGFYPLYNISQSYILSVNLGGFIELGAGIYHNLISVDDKKVKPGIDEQRYPRDVYQKFSYVGSIGPNNDTILYSFKGTKAMGRVTLDPKAFFNLPVFGSEDLKIYGEMAILGLKNYPYWYDEIKDRMPLMFGFNFPAFKILDVLSMELQYWTYPWWNSAENIWKYGSPVPYCGDLEMPFFELADKLRKHNDDWRWSVYASRKIAERIRISIQFASDNMSKTAWSPPPPTYSRYTEIMTSKREWYWVSRIQFYL
jgi:hypothetical protein